MTLNIGNDILNLATEVTATVDLRRLGKLQLAALKRYCRTGVVMQRGIVADLAEKFLGDRPMIVSNTRATRWQGIPVDPENQARRALLACVVLEQIKNGNEKVPYYYSQTAERLANYNAGVERNRACVLDAVTTCVANLKRADIRNYTVTLRNTKPLRSVDFGYAAEFPDEFFDRVITYDLLTNTIGGYHGRNEDTES